MPDARGPRVNALLAVTSTDRVAISSVAIDSAGDLYVGGSFSGTLALLDARATAAGKTDAYIAKLSLGDKPAVQWLRRFGGPDDDRINALAALPAGIAFGGDTHDRFETDKHVVIGAGDPDGFVGVIGSDGNIAWIDTIAASQYSSVLAVASTADGNVAAAGFFGGSMALLGRPVHSAGGQDAFAARFRPTGGVVWAVRAGGPGADSARAVVGTSDGGILVAGAIMDGAQVGGQRFEIDAPAPDLWVGAIDSDGNHRWARGAGGPGADTASAMAAAGTAAYVGGRVNGDAGEVTLYTVDAVNGSGALSPAPIGVDSIAVTAVAASQTPNERIAAVGRVRGATKDESNLPMLVELREVGGGEVWRLTGTADSAIGGRAVAIGPNGTVAVVGQFRGAMQLAARSLKSDPGGSAFIAVVAGGPP